jgi:hypothetical protein
MHSFRDPDGSGYMCRGGVPRPEAGERAASGERPHPVDRFRLVLLDLCQTPGKNFPKPNL